MRLMRRLGWLLKRLGEGSKRESKSKGGEEKGRLIIGKFKNLMGVFGVLLYMCVWKKLGYIFWEYNIGDLCGLAYSISSDLQVSNYSSPMGK